MRRIVVMLTLLSAVVLLPAMGCGEENSDEDYLRKIDVQETHFSVGAEEQAVLCQRALMWLLEFQEAQAIEAYKGADFLRSELRGNCLDEDRQIVGNGQIQIGLFGKSGKLAHGYLMTITKLDGEIVVLLDPLGRKDGEGAKRNARIIAYHLLTGELHEQFLEK